MIDELTSCSCFESEGLLTKNWRRWLLGGVVSILAVYFILSQIDIALFRDAMRDAHYIYVLPSVLFLLAGLVTRAIRWRVLLSDGLSFHRAFSILNVSYFVNGLLPLRAGEFARAYLATQVEPPVPAPKSISTIIVERLLDLLAVLALLFYALISGPVPDELRTVGLIAAPVGIAGFLLLVMLANRPRFALNSLAFFTKRLPILERLPLQKLALQFFDGLAPLRRRRALTQALFWTAISWGFSVAAGYILMFTFYERADWVVTASFIAAAAFAIAVPAVPGNLGTYELSIIVALEALGYGEPASTASAFAVLVHGINLVLYALVGLIGFLQEGVSLNQLSAGVRQLQRDATNLKVATQDVSQRD
ncbi:MAG: UPF0104 family protein [Chloroflexi bacterium]|nr:MAG: UPF0104 family protein [Chloroflexota bacterium]